jgi:hypothetical protein
MSMPGRRLKPVLTAAILCAVAGTAGCGFAGIDGVELQGGVFDALGVSGKTQKQYQEPKIAARPGLVLPPAADRLPQPGPEPAPAAVAQEWPDDDDGRKVRMAAELDRQQAEFCEQAKLKAKMKGGDAAVAEGPKGPCTQSIFGVFSSNSNSQ